MTKPVQLDVSLDDEGVDITVDQPKECGVEKNYFELLMFESAGNIQSINEQNRTTAATVLGALQGTIVANHGKLDPVASRSVSGVLATPIAGPTTQQG